MPLSRFIADLARPVEVFDGGQPVSNRSFESLCVAVARMNEIRRQLPLAQEELDTSLAIAESDAEHDTLMRLKPAPCDVVYLRGFARGDRGSPDGTHHIRLAAFRCRGS